MNIINDEIKNYLTAHKPEYGNSNVVSLMDMLYHHYTELNPIDSEKIRTSFQKLRKSFEYMDEDKFEIVFAIVSDLCIEQERVAFLEGMHVGMRLTKELMEMKNT